MRSYQFDRYYESDLSKESICSLYDWICLPTDQNFFDNQIKRAKSVGIDGFALDVGIDYWQPNRVTTALAATADIENFTMFISFDMASLPFNTSILSTFHFAANHPNYYRVNGRPFFSTFGGEFHDDFWVEWKASSGLNPYFCPLLD